jgi:D-alanyl-D-alanine carboxypeptidase/D-alanyl-D-alanine-endopeptidase (penicillin-binding protein 4)
MYHFFPMVSIYFHFPAGSFLNWMAWVIACVAVFPAKSLWIPLCGLACAFPAAVEAAPVEEQLDAVFRPEECWSVSVADLEENQVIYDHRAHDPRIPASNLKAYVSAAAFDLLGTRFRYRTPLMGEGQFDKQSGIWQGDLLVRGSGDPTFSGRFENDKTQVTGRLERWAQRLVNHGVKAIAGNLYGDDNIFDEDYWGQGWPDGSWCDWYTAPSGGLILNDSCLDIVVQPSRAVGGPVLVGTVPDTKFVQIHSSATTVGRNAKAAISFQRTFGKNDLVLAGKVPVNSQSSQHCVALSDPTGFFMTVFKEVLEKRGIEVRGEARDADDCPDLPTRGWKVLAVNESPPLVDLARVINARSQNLFADSLLKTLGARKAGMGNWAGGAQVIRDWVRSLGISADNLHLQDGSGLSRLNRVTAHGTTEMLVKVSDKPWFGEWRDSLAVSGDSEGSLRKRMVTPLLRGKVRAKTGFINDVYCLSGYLESQTGKTYAFSMLFNGKNHAGKHPHHRMEEALTILARDQP